MRVLGDKLVDIMCGARQEVLLVAPYIKRGALTRILDRCPSAAAIRVVTRWRIDEIALGVSDLEVWPLLRERGNAEIWLQPTLHAKYYRADDRIALGSANLTDAALGWSKSPNLEILEDMGEAYLGRAAFEASLYRNATRVDELLYRSFEVALATFPKPKITPCPTVEYETTFVDWRPVLRFPADLFAYYSGDRDLLTSAAREVAAGELLALQPPPALSEEAFNSWVRLAILQNAEFQAIDEYVVTSRRFGEMRDFLASRGAEDANRAWQTWMRWILHFLPDRLNFHTAGYSEIVSRP